MMRIPPLLPGEHVYSGFVRGRYLSAQMHVSDKVFFELNQLPYHWLRSQTPLCDNLNAVIARMAHSEEEQYQLRLWHTPFAAWLLSLPVDMAPQALTESGVRNNMEESPFNVDKRWKFCPQCAQADRSEFGVSYWHSSHQLLGARVCWRHQCELHSHENLRYLPFKFPHHFLSDSEPLMIDSQWQRDWQSFIYRLSAHLQHNVEWARSVSNLIKTHLGITGMVKHSHRQLFNDMFEQMQCDIGLDCLSGLFTRYARQNGRQPNILWLTLSGYSQARGLHHPLYWLAILFWLRHRLPELGFLNENRVICSK